MASLDVSKFSKNLEVSKLATAVFNSLTQLEEQLNARSQIFVNDTGEIPNGSTPNGDLVTTLVKDTMTIAIPQGRGKSRNLKIEDLGGPYQKPLNPTLTQFLGLVSGVVAPVLASFPNDGDWGFYTNTTVPNLFLCYNLTGVLKKIALT